MNMRVAGASVLMVLGIGLTITMGGPLSHFLDFKSSLFVVSVAAGSTLLYAPFSSIKQAFSSWFTGAPLDEETARNSANTFQQMGHSATTAGLLGTLVGLVLMLQNMDDPTAIGPAMAVGMLTILYGIILGQLLLRGMAASCLKRGGISHSNHQRRDTRSLGLLLASTFIVLFTFTVLLLTMANWGPSDPGLTEAIQSTESESNIQTEVTL